MPLILFILSFLLSATPVRVTVQQYDQTAASHMVSEATYQRVQSFLQSTATRISQKDPTVLRQFDLNGLQIFGGAGIPETARTFLDKYAVPMTVYPDTLSVRRDNGELLAEVTHSGLVSKMAISTYVWYLQPKGQSFQVEQVAYQAPLVAPSQLRLSPMIELDMQPGGLTASERAFNHINVFQFDVINNIPDGIGVNSGMPFVSIYRANDPNADVMKAQKAFKQSLASGTFNTEGYHFIAGLAAPSGGEAYRALILSSGTYIIQGMYIKGNQKTVVEGPTYAVLFTVK